MIWYSDLKKELFQINPYPDQQAKRQLRLKSYNLSDSTCPADRVRARPWMSAMALSLKFSFQ